MCSNIWSHLHENNDIFRGDQLNLYVIDIDHYTHGKLRHSYYTISEKEAHSDSTYDVLWNDWYS